MKFKTLKSPSESLNDYTSVLKQIRAMLYVSLVRQLQVGGRKSQLLRIEAKEVKTLGYLIECSHYVLIMPYIIEIQISIKKKALHR